MAKEHPLVASVRQCIEEQKLLPPPADSPPLYIALSGGSDSVALLLALRELGYSPEALHCNFTLRAEESLGDTDFVTQLCREASTPLQIKTFDTRDYANRQGISIEMAARTLRYSWFAQLIEGRGEGACVAIAHNAQDQIETLILNLSKGTGLRGLSGMPYKREDGIIRPMMQASPSMVLSYLQQRGQRWREDSSNLDEQHQRNYIRHRLLPMFERLNPRFAQSIERTISHLRGAEAFYRESIGRHLAELSLPDGSLGIERLLQAPDPETLLYELLYPKGFSSEQCHSIAQALKDLPSGKVFSSATHRLTRAWDSLILEPIPELSPHLSEEFNPHSTPNGSIALPKGGSLHWRIISTQAIEGFPELRALKLSPREVLLDWDKLQEVSPSLTLRYPREGERIKPLGMERGSKLLSRIFIDKRIPLSERSYTPLIALQDGSPIWLLGLSSEHRYRLTPETSLALHLYIES